MKKKILFTCCMFIVAIIAASFQYYSNKTNVADIMFENVEALAADEFYNSSLRCIGLGSVDCPFNNIKAWQVVDVYSLEKNN